MAYSTRADFEFMHGVRVDTRPWDCDILSVMADKICKYNTITECKLIPKYADPKQRDISLCTLLRDDMDELSQYIPEIANLRDKVDIFQFEGNTPDATILLPANANGKAGIGVSSTFIKYLHLYLSKFMTLLQWEHEGNIHNDFLEEIRKDKWNCLELYLSIVSDASTYSRLNYDREIEDYLFLYQPYDYCDMVIAVRQFALLHELAHLHIKLNYEPDTLNEHSEELVADATAYEWLVRSFTRKKTLTTEEDYELTIRLQAPFHYFAARSIPFAIHHWYDDKCAVVVDNKREYYMLHPLRREMALFASMRHQKLFQQHPEMVKYLYNYIYKEHIAFDPDTFFRHDPGNFSLSNLAREQPAFGRVMEKINMSISDAYHLFSAFDYEIAYEHGLTLGWLHKEVTHVHTNPPEGENNKIKAVVNETYRTIDRRMGLKKTMANMDEIYAEHENRFAQPPMRAYDISTLGYKRWFGILQIDMQIIADESEKDIKTAIAELSNIGAELEAIQAARNIDGETSLLLVGLSVDFVIGTSAGVLAAYIYDLLKKIGGRKIRLEGEIIPATKADIEAFISLLEEKNGNISE